MKDAFQLWKSNGSDVSKDARPRGSKNEKKNQRSVIITVKKHLMPLYVKTWRATVFFIHCKILLLEKLNKTGAGGREEDRDRRREGHAWIKIIIKINEFAAR